jgi:hypothetical protein
MDRKSNSGISTSLVSNLHRGTFKPDLYCDGVGRQSPTKSTSSRDAIPYTGNMVPFQVIKYHKIIIIIRTNIRYTAFTYLSGLIFVVCDVRDLPELRHLTRLNYFLGYINIDAQAPDARSPERLNFVLRLKILVVLQLRICFMSLFWRLGFSGDCRIFGKFT